MPLLCLLFLILFFFSTYSTLFAKLPIEIFVWDIEWIILD
jgi:hypothetical protein